MNYKIFISDVLPAIITAFVSTIAIITSYLVAKNASKQSYNNNVDSMKFTQKEKVSDQIGEKSAILLTKSDPNVLNTVINKMTPRIISHEENANIRIHLLGIAKNGLIEVGPGDYAGAAFLFETHLHMMYIIYKYLTKQFRERKCYYVITTKSGLYRTRLLQYTGRCESRTD